MPSLNVNKFSSPLPSSLRLLANCEHFIQANLPRHNVSNETPKVFHHHFPRPHHCTSDTLSIRQKASSEHALTTKRSLKVKTQRSSHSPMSHEAISMSSKRERRSERGTSLDNLVFISGVLSVWTVGSCSAAMLAPMSSMD